MTKWMSWLLLTMLTGSPFVSLLIILVLWLVLDRFTLQILPDPLQGFARTKRASRLVQTIEHNPHDRRARRELAEIYVQQRRFAKADETIRYNLEQKEEDPSTLFVAGVAKAGLKQRAEAEGLLERLREKEPGYRMNAIDLELGRMYLALRAYDPAVSTLESLCQARPGSVEGKALLARALKGKGDAARAKEVSAAAWKDYASAPGFQKRKERYWAWRLQPWRPALYGLILVAVVFTLGQVFAPTL
jgi:hypothetical protein